ncbi:MAG: hypothetical protein SNF33_02655 [Candidatus Algichlamydia australiensis]|nr:hypothetical protein [Chlamydiales bacterium]
MKGIKLLFIFTCFSLFSFEKEFTPIYILLSEKLAVENPLEIADDLIKQEEPTFVPIPSWGKCAVKWAGKKKSEPKGFYLYLNGPESKVQMKGYATLNYKGYPTAEGFSLSSNLHPRINVDMNISTNDLVLRSKNSFETAIGWKY